MSRSDHHSPVIAEADARERAASSRPQGRRPRLAGADPAVDGRVAGAAAVVAALPGSALLIAPEGRVIAANAAARRIVADSPLFIDVAGRLRASIPRIERAVLSALRAADDGSQVVRVTDFGPGGDLVLTVSRLPDGPFPGVDEAGDAPDLCIVTIAHEVTDPAAVIATMRRIYGLDECEAAAAFAMYSGQRLHHFAEMQGLDVYTASTVQESLMRRLGAHRASDVARRVALASQAAPPSSPGAWA